MTVPERAGREGDSQALPTKNDAQDIQSRVIEMIEKRRELGIKRYGTALQPHNGRDALLDLQEELLDALMYVTQERVERQQRLDDHNHEDANAAVRYVNETTPFDPEHPNRFEYADRWLKGLADRGYVIIKKEHA